MNAKPIRVLVAEDHPVMRGIIRQLLSAEPILEVVAEVASGEEAVRRSRELNPEVALLDLTLPGINGLDAARQIGAAPAPPRIIILMEDANEEYRAAALASGAVASLAKDRLGRELVPLVMALGDRRGGAKAPSLSWRTLTKGVGMDALNEGSGFSRRDMLRYGLWGVGGLIVAMVGAPVTGYFIAPALKQEGSVWVPAVPLKDIPLGVPTPIEYMQRSRDGWVRSESRHSAWVLTRDRQNFVAYDPRCTHLGCAYAWKPERGQFFCPCHDGVFDVDGKVISGPPPRALDRYETKVMSGVLYLGQIIKGESA